MKVLFVINNLYAKGNGLSASARRTINKLKEANIEVEALSGKNPENNGIEPKFKLEHLYFPIFDRIIKKQGYVFAKSDIKVIEEAVKWADVIHLEEPFFLQNKVVKIAIKYHKPLTATYHLHPENLFSSIHLEDSHILNDPTMYFWKKMVFDHCKIVQCPTINVLERLKKWNYKAELRVISNGLDIEELNEDRNIKKIKISDAKYHIISVGRYSVEKDLITILRSMKYSKYNKDIKLIFAGRGPEEKRLKRYADKLVKKGILKYPPLFGFYKLNEIESMAKSSDIYIHSAFIEVEGLGCMESIQTGLLPIIAKSKYSATSQFALCEESIYKARDSRDLASKIDYWLEDEKRRKKWALKYKGIAKDYNINYSIDALIKMFNDAINNK